MSDELHPESFSCPRPHRDHETIQLGHGSGGSMSSELISNLFVAAFDNEVLNRLDDQATLHIGGATLSFSTDSFVVDPIFFPGGDIGDLAVNGTVNDICMNGARPLYLSAGFIIEEGLQLGDLERIVASMRRAADIAGVQIVTGDTKVVDKGAADKIFINTAGIGLVEHPHKIGADCVRPGDMVLVSGPIGNHGVAILSQREGLAFETKIKSDTAALNHLVASIIASAGDGIHAMRDPTRGGVAATLNEFARSSGVGIRLNETQLPIDPAVNGACELLGLDPLYVANEGKLVAVVDPVAAEAVLQVMQQHPLAKQAAMIGEVHDTRPGQVTIRTAIGGERIVDMPPGEQLPRIC